MLCDWTVLQDIGIAHGKAGRNLRTTYALRMTRGVIGHWMLLSECCWEVSNVIGDVGWVLELCHDSIFYVLDKCKRGERV